MYKVSEKDFVSLARQKTVGAMHDWLLSEEGIAALEKFVSTQFATLDKLDAAPRVLNLMIISSHLQQAGVLPVPYNTSPWLLFLSCDNKAWAAFENTYFEYYIQCSSILV